MYGIVAWTFFLLKMYYCCKVRVFFIVLILSVDVTYATDIINSQYHLKTFHRSTYAGGNTTRTTFIIHIKNVCEKNTGIKPPPLKVELNIENLRVRFVSFTGFEFDVMRNELVIHHSTTYRIYVFFSCIVQRGVRSKGKKILWRLLDLKFNERGHFKQKKNTVHQQFYVLSAYLFYTFHFILFSSIAVYFCCCHSHFVVVYNYQASSVESKAKNMGKFRLSTHFSHM